MKLYGRPDRDSGIIAYEIALNSVTLQFKDGSTYQYTERSAGKDRIDAMKKLAVAGEGLTTYINKYVRKKYAAKLS